MWQVFGSFISACAQLLGKKFQGDQIFGETAEHSSCCQYYHGEDENTPAVSVWYHELYRTARTGRKGARAQYFRSMFILLYI